MEAAPECMVCWLAHIRDRQNKMAILMAYSLMRQKFEKPQKGNPHRLPVKQHVWPRDSIARFADGTSMVCLFDKVRNKARQAKPDDDIFCASGIGAPSLAI
jgi:hypothetical protein